MEVKIILDMLTQDKVIILKQNYVNVDGIEYMVGNTWRSAYMNSTEGRARAQLEVIEPYLSAIMAIWGTTPTVVENTDISTS